MISGLFMTRRALSGSTILAAMPEDGSLVMGCDAWNSAFSLTVSGL
jgi:hypothetical protein